MSQAKSSKNYPAPSVDREIQKELTRIGGVIPYGFGKLSGQPVLKLGWGMTEKTFDSGKQRIRFWDQDIQPIFTPRNYCLTMEAAMTHLTRWYNLRKAQMVKAYKNQDWNTYHAFLFAPAASYLKRVLSPADWWEMPKTSSPEEAARLLPEGYFYFQDNPEVEEIGCENFFVMQWIPPFEICDRKQWADTRFGISPIIDLNGYEFFVDILGEYPKYGEYSNVLLKIQKEDGSYEVPAWKNTIEPLQKMIQEAQKNKKDKKAQTKINIKSRYQKATELEQEKYKKHREILTEHIHEEGQIIIRGSKALIFPKENRTFWGKPKEIIKGN